MLIHKSLPYTINPILEIIIPFVWKLFLILFFFSLVFNKKKIIPQTHTKPRLVPNPTFCLLKHNVVDISYYSNGTNDSIVLLIVLIS